MLPMRVNTKQLFLLTSGNNPIHQWQSITKVLSRGGQGREVAKARPYPPRNTVCHVELWQVSHEWCQKHSQKAQETSKERHDSAAESFTQPACDWSKQIHDAHTDWAHPCWGKTFNNVLVESKGKLHWNVYRYLVNTVEALLSDSLVSGQLHLRPPPQNPVSKLPFKFCIYTFP